ncbi:MAG: (d)CMP kinase [Acidimicrobiales bacterium]
MVTVAIDGPGGAGKSTLAGALAARLGLERLDSGAMYRVLALAALRGGMDPANPDAMSGLAAGLAVRLDGASVWLDGADVSGAIRSHEVTRAASMVAVHPGVRAELVARQRAWVAERGGGVVEGRDIGTVVCPDAELKIYLTAEHAERSRRRSAEVDGASADRAVAAELASRDRADSTRTASPLEVAPGAVVMDSTDRSVDNLVAEVLGLLAETGVTW